MTQVVQIQQKSHVQKLMVKLLILVAPVLLIVLFYLVCDPFKVVWHYSDYYPHDKSSRVVLDRDYVSTQTYLQQRRQTPYEAFIFGNSRSIFYPVKDWSRYIGTTNCFHFDASDEGLYGIWCKVRLLDSLNAPLRNALLILDAGTLSQTNNPQGHLFIKHPQLSGQSWFAFEFIFLRTFFDPQFLVAYTDFRVSGKLRPYMLAWQLFDSRRADYRPANNELSLGEFDSLLATNPAAYYQTRTNLFYARPAVEVVSPPAIGDLQMKMLRDIADIMRKNHADCRIVINPLYNQKRLNPADLQALQNTFGTAKVFDFSGKNRITEEMTNYYETSHYRPTVSRRILAEVYAGTGDVAHAQITASEHGLH